MALPGESQHSHHCKTLRSSRIACARSKMPTLSTVSFILLAVVVVVVHPTQARHRDATAENSKFNQEQHKQQAAAAAAGGSAAAAAGGVAAAAAPSSGHDGKCCLMHGWIWLMMVRSQIKCSRLLSILFYIYLTVLYISSFSLSLSQCVCVCVHMLMYWFVIDTHTLVLIRVVYVQ